MHFLCRVGLLAVVFVAIVRQLLHLHRHPARVSSAGQNFEEIGGDLAAFALFYVSFPHTGQELINRLYATFGQLVAIFRV